MGGGVPQFDAGPALLRCFAGDRGGESPIPGGR